MKKFALNALIYVVTFVCVWMVMNVVDEKKSLENNYEDEVVGDKEDYVFSFDEVTIPNKKIVAFDNSDIDYIRYYVVEFTGDQFVTYSYYFLKGHNQYVEKYGEFAADIVDYNYDEFMIKTLDDISYGKYDDIYNNLQYLINDNSIYLVY